MASGWNSANERIPFNQWLKKMQRDDLKNVEKDLDYYEKVSVAFLLFGSLENRHLLYALQKLLTMYNCQKDESQILYEYACLRPDDEWQLPIVEVLAIIKAYRVLRNLGFDKTEIHEILLPHVPELSVAIHPMIKTLYVICESLTPAESGQLLLTVNQSSELRFYDSKYMEIYLMDWISKGVIAIGNIPKKTPPDLDVLIEYFKFNDKIALFDKILSAIKHINESIRLRSRNVNDCVTSFSTNVSSSKSFDKKDSVELKEIDMRYKVTFETAGYLLIINQLVFHRETDRELKRFLPQKDLAPRIGSEVDEKNLVETFSQFGYKCVVKQNLEHHKILPVVRDFVLRSEAYDSLIVCILSHGSEGLIYGCNSIPVKISDLEDTLRSEKLLNKPKLLIIQACQGDELQTAQPIPDNEELDGPSDSASRFSDLLVYMSTVPKFASVRHKLEGTWLIQTLCKHVKNFGDRKHIYDILTMVNGEVQNKRGNKDQCMVPIFSSTLGKYLYLPTRKS